MPPVGRAHMGRPCPLGGTRGPLGRLLCSIVVVVLVSGLTLANAAAAQEGADAGGGDGITAIEAEGITATEVVRSIQELLTGRMPGLVVLPGSGQVGSDATIRIGGPSSFRLSQAPLIVVDDMRLSGTRLLGVNAVAPEDVERIEVIEGPMGAALYGAEAAGGVIRIVTRRGAPGRARYTFSTAQGTTFLMDPEGRWPVNYRLVNGEVRSLDLAELQRRYGRPVFSTAHTQRYHGSVDGGSDWLRYFASATHERTPGVEPNNRLRRTGAHVNVALAAGNRFDLTTNLNYAAGRADRARERAGLSRMGMTVLMNPAAADDPELRGFFRALPEQADEQRRAYRTVDRFTTTLRMAYRPTRWLSHELLVGVDQAHVVDARRDSIPADETLEEQRASSAVGLTQISYAATARAGSAAGVRSATTVGAQAYSTRTTDVAEARTMPSSIEDSTFSISEQVTKERVFGVYVQEALAWKGRRFLSLALRTDKDHAFGSALGSAVYPSVSASWAVSEEPFWRLGALNDLRLRAAYAESARRLEPDDTTFRASASPAVPPVPQGLRAERVKRFEVGLDASALDDRVGLAVTYYAERASDLVWAQPIAASTGVTYGPPVNVGAVRNRGLEVAARVVPVRTAAVTWELSGSLAANDNEVRSLGDLGLSALAAGEHQQHRVGYPLGAWFGKRIVSARLDADGTAIDLRCDDGQGGTTACPTAPSVYLGSAIPNRQGAVGSTLTLGRRFTLHALVDFQLGQKRFDGNEELRCSFAIAGAGRCRERYAPQDYDPVRIAAIQNQYPFYLITDAGFFKLREVSASYTLPARWAAALRASAASVTVAARNLHTWTDYAGLEPEAFATSSDPAAAGIGVDQLTTPMLSAVVASVRLTY